LDRVREEERDALVVEELDGGEGAAAPQVVVGARAVGRRRRVVLRVGERRVEDAKAVRVRDL